MATILFVWECGGGNGHLTRYKKLIDHLCNQGHQVAFAVRNLRSAVTVYPDQKVLLFPAPIALSNPSLPHKVLRPKSYLDVLINQCFDQQQELQSRVRAWLTLFRALDPNLIIADHSPTALMACKAFPQYKCLIYGDAFAVPPTQGSLVPFSTNFDLTEADLIRQDKQLVDEFLNPCLASFSGPQLTSCMDIFDQPQRIFGIPELDHYAEADRTELFIGHQKSSGGEKPIWPKTAGPKVFIYSENHPQLKLLLRILSQLKWPVIAVAKPPARKLMSQFQSESFSYLDEFVDIEQVAKECDFAITNANLTTCMNFIREGKSMLILPAHIEQSMSAKRLVEKNCAIEVSYSATPHEIKQKVLRIAEPNGEFQIQTRAFALKIQPSLQQNADEIMRNEVLSLL